MSDIRIIIQKVPTRDAQGLQHQWRVEQVAPKKGEAPTVVALGTRHSEGDALRVARIAAKNYRIALEYGEQEFPLEAEGA